MSLWSDFVSNDGLRSEKSVHYFPIYERYFSRFRNLDVVIFEIGVYQGGSLKLWKKYFGPNAKIVGVDIDEKCAAAEEDQVFVRIGNQRDTKFLERLVEEFGVPDIVIDDGSHQSADISATFDYLYPKQARNSIYLVEDTFICYREDSDVGTGKAESFMERTKAMIDLLHAGYSRVNIKESWFTNATYAIHIYDSIVVFEKHGINRHVAVTGNRKLFDEPVSNSKLEEDINRVILR